MIASLPMYMRPELIEDHNVFWSLIVDRLGYQGRDSVSELQHPSDFNAFWLDKNLLLSQTCGMPYRNGLHGKVQLVGTPDYKVHGCEPGYYRSAIVVRKDDRYHALSDYKSKVFAYNAENSQSGFSAAFWHSNKEGFWFEKTLITGGHQLSAEAVAEGRADIASIDAVTWRLLCEYESVSNELHVLEWTDPTPGLPYITSLQNDRSEIFEAVNLAIDALSPPAKERLGIHSLINIDARDYLAVPNPEI